MINIKNDKNKDGIWKYCLKGQRLVACYGKEA